MMVVLEFSQPPQSRGGLHIRGDHSPEAYRWKTTFVPTARAFQVWGRQFRIVVRNLRESLESLPTSAGVFERMAAARPGGPCRVRSRTRRTAADRQDCV